MAVTFNHADGPGKITGPGQNGTVRLDFERLTTGQVVFVSVDFMIDPSGPVAFEIIAADNDAVPITPNKTTVSSPTHVFKRALFRVTKQADAAVGVVEVLFEVNFLDGKGTWQDFTIIGETAAEHQ
jgi:hypothetical protein